MRIIKEKLSEIYGIDERAIVLFRVFLGVILMADIMLRITTVNAFFSDWGILPRWVQIKSYTEEWRLNLYYLAGNKYYLTALLLVNGYFVWLFMTAKKNIKLIAFILWVFLSSLHARNYMILQSGDTILRLVVMWFLFFPEMSFSLNGNFSESPRRKLFNLGVLGYYVQIATIYFYAGYAKSYESYFAKGDAVFLAMELERYSTDLGQWLMQFPEFLRFGSRMTYALEMLCPLLIFFPIKNWIVRFAAFIGLSLFHVGTILMMEVGHFPHASIVMWIPLIPTQVLDFIFKKKNEKATFFKITKRRLPLAEKVFLSFVFLKNSSWGHEVSSSPRGQYKIDDCTVEIDEFYKIIYLKSFFGRLFSNAIFVFFTQSLIKLNELIVEIFNDNRDRIRLVTKWSVSGVCLYFIFFTFVLNLNKYKVYNYRIKRMAESAKENYFMRFGVNIDQRWGMFSPTPTKMDGWHIVYGERFNGNKVDLWGTNFTKPLEKPDSVADTYKNFRWRKFLGGIMGKSHKHYRKYFWQSVCYEVNDRTVDPLKKIKKVYHRFVLENTAENGVEPLKYLDYGAAECKVK